MIIKIFSREREREKGGKRDRGRTKGEKATTAGNNRRTSRWLHSTISLITTRILHRIARHFFRKRFNCSSRVFRISSQYWSLLLKWFSLPRLFTPLPLLSRISVSAVPSFKIKKTTIVKNTWKKTKLTKSFKFSNRNWQKGKQNNNNNITKGNRVYWLKLDRNHFDIQHFIIVSIQHLYFVDARRKTAGMNRL